MGDEFEPDHTPGSSPQDQPRPVSADEPDSSSDASSSAFGARVDEQKQTAPARSSGSDSEAVAAVRSWPVLARAPLTPERIVQRAEAEPGSEQAERVLALHETMRERTVLYARQQELLVAFFTHDPATDGLIEEADISAMKVATGLRVTTNQAERLLRDAHRSLDLLPATFTHLAAGVMPEGFHQYLVRHVRSLTDEQVRAVDEHVGDWDLASISRHKFETNLKTLIVRITAGSLPVAPQTQRRVDLEIADPQCGLATLTVTGPIPEIKALAHRLDVSALSVQKAQRAALQDNDEGEIPFDLDETVRDRGRPLSLKALQYAILTHTVLETDPVPEPASPYRMLVTAPAMTLLGMDDAPGMIDGLTPIPAEQARALAAGQATWQRILTDPTTGAYLPANADTYTPTAQMRLQLRLRHPVCAAPGCTRATVLAAEDDHIEEFNHHDPTTGGATDLANLHRLCWLHHKIKTAGGIDPQRHPTGADRASPTETEPKAPPDRNRSTPVTHPPGSPPPRRRAPAVVEPTVTWWTIDGDVRTTTREDVDLLTPHLARALDTAWATHHRAHDDAIRLRETEAARPKRDRIIEQRNHERERFAHRHHPKKHRPADTPHDYDEPPPF